MGAAPPTNPQGLAHNYLSRTPHRTAPVDLTFEGLGKIFLQFRKSRYFRPFYLVILAILVTGLFQFTAGPGALECLGILLIPTTVLVIPYWLGERSLKNFAINALPVFVLALLLISAFQTQAVLSQGPVALTTGYDPATPNDQLPHLSMWEGSVVPASGAPNQVYTFHVRLKEVVNGTVVPPANVTTISVNITAFTPLPSDRQIVVPMTPDPLRNTTTNGTWYTANRTLGDSVWQFYFWANDTRGNWTFAAAPVLLPVIAGAGTYYVFWMANVLIYLLFPVSFYFIIVFMYWYTIRMRRMRERMMDRARAEKLDLDKGEGKKKTEEGGGPEVVASDAAAKTKKAAAFTCTNCGADVTEDDAKCPKCGAVFED